MAVSDDLNFNTGTLTSPEAVSTSPAGRQGINRSPRISGIQPHADPFGALTGLEHRQLHEPVQRGLASRGCSSGRIIFDPKGRETIEAGIHRLHKLVVDGLGLWRYGHMSIGWWHGSR